MCIIWCKINNYNLTANISRLINTLILSFICAKLRSLTSPDLVSATFHKIICKVPVMGISNC
jgi:hypothetical protein